MNYSLRYRHRTIDLANWRLLRVVWLAIAVLLFAAGRCWAATVDITLPQAVSFAVADVTSSTSAIENPTTVSFTDFTGGAIGIYIKADAENFTRPDASGGYIPASNVSWTATGLAAIFSPGTLSSIDYMPLYQYDLQEDSFTMSWTLAAPGTAVYAGTHTLTATWKLESLL